jgi:DNA-binding NarL/FixJ family response regulator
MQFTCNCCAGGMQTMQAFLLGEPEVPFTYASTVAAMYRLTPREAQTLEALLQGLSIKDVAMKVGINPSTAKTFLRSISGKMGVSGRAELMSKVLSLSCSESLQCPFQTALAACPPTEIRI